MELTSRVLVLESQLAILIDELDPGSEFSVDIAEGSSSFNAEGNSCYGGATVVEKASELTSEQR